MKAYAKGLHH